MKIVTWKCDRAGCPRIVEGSESVPKTWINRTGKLPVKKDYEAEDLGERVPQTRELTFCTDACNQKQKASAAVAEAAGTLAWVKVYDANT